MADLLCQKNKQCYNGKFTMSEKNKWCYNGRGTMSEKNKRCYNGRTEFEVLVDCLVFCAVSAVSRHTIT